MRLILVLSITILAGTLDVLAREEIREDIPIYDATSSALNDEELDEDLLLHDEGGKRKRFTREKECAMFDSLWNVGTYKYIIPSQSFCSDYCPHQTEYPTPSMSEPFWFECKLQTMPRIDFFMVNNQSCSVVSRNGKNDRSNQACINRVASSLTGTEKSYPTLIYIAHGFVHSEYQNTYTGKMKDSLLNRYKARNIVVGIVAWEHGSRINNTNVLPIDIGIESRSRTTMFDTILSKYVFCCELENIWQSATSAAANTWAIGNVLAYVDRQIKKATIPTRYLTSCVGFSLGAHLCGFFGKMVKILDPNFPVDKIIGLDPMGPIWEYNDSELKQDPELRLNNQDATTVEIYHTSYLGFRDPLGDLDFYINGGVYQPSCWEDLGEMCSHFFAPDLFTSLNNKAESCVAYWKCNITKGLTLENIRNENEEQLKLAGCFRHTEVKLGLIDETIGNKNGVYWVHADKNSKSCKYERKKEEGLLGFIYPWLVDLIKSIWYV